MNLKKYLIRIIACNINKKYRVSYEEKIKFTEKVSELSEPNLDDFVTLMQKMDSKAIQQTSEGKFRIIVDDIDKATFIVLTEFLDSKDTQPSAEPYKKIRKLQ